MFLFLLVAYVFAHPNIMSFREWHAIYGNEANHYSRKKDLESREKAFNANVEKIKAHNAKNLSWVMGVNHFSDLTAEEFSDLMNFDNCQKIMNSTQRYLDEQQKGKLPQMRNPKNLPEVDYRNKNNPLNKVAVTNVKNQASCGSCWSFSASGAVEGAWVVGGHELVSLSEQELVSCDKQDSGCNGGLMDWAFDFVKDHGLTSESIYPYVSGNGRVPACDSSKVNQPIATITDYKDVAHSEEALENALNIGPVAIAIEADQYAFQSYSSGVLTGECGSQLDHGVLAVGYGHDNSSNLDYWIVKNSWGSNWGMSGYVLLQRHVASSAGQCGILMQASYPIAGNVLPTPTPTPSPGPAPSSDDYEDPTKNKGCKDSETKVIDPYGVDGAMCMPPCHSTSDCPATPDGWSDPTCILPYGRTMLCGVDCKNSTNSCKGGTICTDVLGVLDICLYEY